MNKPNKTFSAGGIVVCTNEVLLVCENGNFWGFPKGRIEADETEPQAAAREIREETGLKAFSLVRKLGSYTRSPYTIDNQPDESELKTITMYLFSADNKELGMPFEANAVGQWVHRNEAHDLLTHPADRAFYGSIRHHMQIPKP